MKKGGRGIFLTNRAEGNLRTRTCSSLPPWLQQNVNLGGGSEKMSIRVILRKTLKPDKILDFIMKVFARF